jgi:hypothetical protein
MSICIYIYIIQLFFTVYTVYLFIYLGFFQGAHAHIYNNSNNNNSNDNNNSHDNNNNTYVDRLMHVTS